MKIRDFIAKNNEDIEVMIDRNISLSCNFAVETIYRGRLGDIPESLWDLEAIKEWSVANDTYVLNVGYEGDVVE